MVDLDRTRAALVEAAALTVLDVLERQMAQRAAG